ncbi:MAG: c-type cytochrome [Burkholderiales bacterium]|nr:c-type cytochrome [Burkholderiales bacterium]
MRRAALVFALLAACPASAAEPVVFDPREVQAIQRHGPWPQPVLPDRSNRAWGNPAAIALGQKLFFDSRLSGDGTMACASCHVPARAWTDGRPRAHGREPLARNVPTVLDAGRGRWFGWDGGSDSAWSFSLRPILDARELASSPPRVAALLREDAAAACLHEAAFGAAASDEAAMVNAAKALGAFLATLASGRTAFDEFRDALAKRDAAGMARYPEAAKRGLRLFVGRGNCAVCHFGPDFTNGEFHDVGVPFFAAPGKVDGGRYDGVKRLMADPYNLLGRWNDDASGAAATKTRHLHSTQRDFGRFKTPSLRNVALTAPYMHNGSLATLADVVRHYSEIDTERIHSHGEQLLRPLGLTPGEIADLVAFLETLSAPDAMDVPALPPVVAGCRVAP